jgi:predicted HicB family RNase H-like nuclease
MGEEVAMPGHEASDLVPLATRVSDRLRRAVKARAALEGRPVQALVTQALTEYLAVHAEPASETEPARSEITNRP